MNFDIRSEASDDSVDIEFQCLAFDATLPRGVVSYHPAFEAQS